MPDIRYVCLSDVHFGAEACVFADNVLVEKQRLARFEHMTGQTGWRHGLPLLPLAALDGVRHDGLPTRLVDDDDHHDLGVEDLLDLVADGVIDRLIVQLSRNRVLHAVDQRQFSVPLPRLVHKTRVLQRDAQAPRQRFEQLLV